MRALARRRTHINLDRLESFVAVAECGGVTAAAKRLGCSQPTVSQQLARLETQLGRQILSRGPGGLGLTAEGRRLLPLARSLLSLHGELAAPGERAALRIGACSNVGIYLLPQMLMELRRCGRAVPQVAIAGNPEIERGLLAGEIDVALMEWWSGRSGFASKVWREEQVVAILPKDHPLARCRSVTLGALRSESLLGGERGTGTGRLLRSCMQGDEPLETAMTLGSTEAVKRAVAAGLGVSLVLALSVAEHLGGLAIRPLSPPLRKPLHLVWRGGIAVSDGLVAFLSSAGQVQ